MHILIHCVFFFHYVCLSACSYLLKQLLIGSMDKGKKQSSFVFIVFLREETLGLSESTYISIHLFKIFLSYFERRSKVINIFPIHLTKRNSPISMRASIGNNIHLYLVELRTSISTDQVKIDVQNLFLCSLFL